MNKIVAKSNNWQNQLKAKMRKKKKKKKKATLLAL